ncbi:GNAT family N-acetyltransferase [Subsaxibacter sp. CAU 1640]|uniref:GNAT family N-acetyltransferase n=1 Tax=Subsaxibacter sp. CAU 1640 TaxID=2933271 RepID=UPI00200692C1|nr:GNAT family N-acetyltransferase [Subsaxibacter sp. CAU 1640]MCK7590536.1 GNAT family N-acetyltransferase [Subsaxibacter sp. CAU 1640]
MDVEVKHRSTGKKGSFYVEIEGEQEAEMTYTHAGSDKIIIDHTEVGEQLKGQGVGYQLLDATVDFMRKNNLKAIPLCPFAKAVFDKKADDYADVRA